MSGTSACGATIRPYPAACGFTYMTNLSPHWYGQTVMAPTMEVVAKNMPATLQNIKGEVLSGYPRTNYMSQNLALTSTQSLPQGLKLCGHQ